VALNDVTDEGRFPTPAQRCQVYAEAAALVQTLLDEMTALHTTTERLAAYGVAARRQGIKLPLDGCLDATLQVRLMVCRQVAKRLTRLATVEG
jgi:hypothetical protein